MTAPTAKVSNRSSTNAHTKACLSRERRTCKVVRSVRMELCTRVNSRMISSMDMASCSMRMASQAMRATGIRVLCTEMDYTSGQMAVDTRANTRMTRRMASVSTCGLTGVPTMACGKMAVRMAKELR